MIERFLVRWCRRFHEKRGAKNNGSTVQWAGGHAYTCRICGRRYAAGWTQPQHIEPDVYVISRAK